MNIKSMSQDEKVKYMTTAPVAPLITKLAVPTIISMLVSSAYNMVDTMFVGKINTQSTGAVGIAFSVMALLQAVGFFFGHGSGNSMSRKLGSRDYEGAQHMAATGFFSALFSGCVIGILGVIFITPICRFLGSTETILPYAKAYIRILFLGTPFILGSFVINNQMRFQGCAGYAMFGIISGAVLNIALDPVFIFWFDMGISGAALATVLSQATAFFVLLILNRHFGTIKIRWGDFKLDSEYYKEIFKGGIPSLCRQGIGSVAVVCLNYAAGKYGGNLADETIAAMGVVSRITMFVNSALIGFGQGFQPVCGTNFGAKKYSRVSEAYYFCVKVGTLALIALASAELIFAEPLIEIFRDDPTVIEIGVFALRAQTIVFPLNAVIVMCNMMLQTIGYSFMATLVSSARQGLFFIPLIFALPYFMGVRGVQICQMVADVLTFILALPVAIYVTKKLEQMSKKMNVK